MEELAQLKQEKVKIKSTTNYDKHQQGRNQKIQKGVAGTLASYIDVFNLSENSIKIIQNVKEKEVAAAPSTHP